MADKAEPMTYTKVTFQGQRDAYTFDIIRDTDGTYLATCDLGDIGGINTASESWETLLTEMVPDAVETWETK